jgi:hypothetical protein
MKSLIKYQVPVDYLHDSKITDCDKSTKISMAKFEQPIFDPFLSVKKTNSKVLPFIFFNHIEMNYAVKLGENSIDRDYSLFFNESFAIESQRIGCYSLTDKPIENDYTLEIVYDSCKTISKYQKSSTILFLIFAYSMSSQEFGFPAQTELSVRVTLRKGDKMIFEKSYRIKKMQPFIPSDNKNINVMHLDFVSNMAESLSLGTKECIEQIIQDINLMIVIQ